jgi:outer membrane protein assembly factor BamB
MISTRQHASRPGAGPRWFHLGAVMAAAATTLGMLAAVPAPASASTARATLRTGAATAPAFYAYALGAAKAPQSCPQTTVAAQKCTLAEALALVPAGGDVLLATKPASATYYGNFTLATSKTSATAPVTIEPAAGIAGPVIDGDASAKAKCPTSTCKAAVLTVNAGVFTTLSGLTITDGNDASNDSGGGIRDLGTVTLTGVTISHAGAQNGGGVGLGRGASLQAQDSTFASDTARLGGGAVSVGSVGTATATIAGTTFSGDTAPQGGAINNGSGGTGTVTVTDSTFSADTGTARGGAIENADAGTGTVTVSESTFAADSSPHGAAVDSGAGSGTGTATLLSDTIDGSKGGPALNDASGVVQLGGSIVAASAQGNCAGQITDAGYNLEDDAAASCGFTQREADLIGVSPDLGPLASNGGPTQTMAPAPASPVLDQVPSPGEVYLGNGSPRRVCPAADQAGDQAADQTYGCAMGSVSPAASLPVVTSVSAQFGPVAGGNTVTITGGNFAAGATVKFGSAAATNVTVVSATQITATAPAFGGQDNRGPVTVTVTDPAGTSPARVGALYTYYAASWSSYMDGPGHDSYNPGATAINQGTIGRLQPVWQWNPPASPNAGSVAELSSPVVADGVVYVGLADGEFYAVSEATQQVLWSQFLGFYPSTTCEGSEGFVSTAAVATDPSTGQPTVYVNAPNGYMYAITASTGDVVWRSVVGIPSTKQNDYYGWGSPLVANGKVYVGVSSRCSTPDVRGGAIGFNQATGAQIGRWYDQPGTTVGGSVWSSLAALPNGNIVISTGNGNNAVPQVPYAESVAELRGTTLGFVDGWHLPKYEQIYDSDFGSSPTVFTAYPNGAATTMVGACDKNGYYYAFRANDIHAGPQWRQMIGAAAGAAPAGGGECDSSAIWNGHQLIIGGDGTTINGTAYQGSVQALNPTTGKPAWQTGLPGNVIGTPTEDGGGVIAAPIYQSSTGNTGVYLLAASTGAILSFIPTSAGGLFAQPAWDGGDLLVGAIDSTVPLTAYAITTAGQPTPVTVAPATAIAPGATATLTITATGGLAAPANVIVSGGAVKVTSVSVTSPTTATVKVLVSSSAPAGALNVTLTEPGTLTAYTCTACLTVS